MKFIILFPFIFATALAGESRSANIVQAHVAKVRRMGEKTYGNQYELVDGLSRDLHEHGFICPKRKHIESSCFYRGFKKAIKSAHKENLIDKITYYMLRQIGRKASFNPELVIEDENKREIKKRRNLKLPTLTLYLQNKQEFENKNKKPLLHKKIMNFFNENYRRKIKGIGRVSVEEYLFATYSRTQMQTLSELIELTMKGSHMVLAEAVLSSFDFKAIAEEIEKNQEDMNINFNVYTRYEKLKDYAPEYREKAEVAKEKFNLLYEETRKLQKEVESHDYLQQLKSLEQELTVLKFNQINDNVDNKRTISLLETKKEMLKVKIKENFLIIDISPDAYQLLVNNLDIELKALTFTDQFQKKTPTRGDAILAAYYYGLIEQKSMESLIELEEFKEDRKKFLRSAGNIVISLSRMFLVANPATSAFAIFGFIFYDSIRGKKDYEENEKRNAHLIRY